MFIRTLSLPDPLEPLLRGVSLSAGATSRRHTISESIMVTSKIERELQPSSCLPGNGITPAVATALLRR